MDNFINSFVLNEQLKGNSTKSQNLYKQGYDIKFPAKAKYTKKVIDSEYGKLTNNIYALEPTNDTENSIYMSSETIYPNGVLNERNIKELNAFYNESIDASITATNGRLISKSDYLLDNKLGKEFKFNISDSTHIFVCRIFFINSRSYTIAVMTTDDKMDNKSMTTFLNSFKIR